MRTRLKLGQWNAICDRCGFKFKSGELKKDWQGLMVCKDDFELRNQQDFLRIRPERIVPEWVRPRPPDVFVVSQGFLDKVSIDSGEQAGQDYIEGTYFLEDYLAGRFIRHVQYVRDFSDTTTTTDQLGSPLLTKGLFDFVDTFENVTLRTASSESVNDAVTPADTGSALLFNYVDSSYFAEDYVGTRTTF